MVSYGFEKALKSRHVQFAYPFYKTTIAHLCVILGAKGDTYADDVNFCVRAVEFMQLFHDYYWKGENKDAWKAIVHVFNLLDRRDLTDNQMYQALGRTFKNIVTIFSYKDNEEILQFDESRFFDFLRNALREAHPFPYTEKQPDEIDPELDHAAGRNVAPWLYYAYDEEQ